MADAPKEQSTISNKKLNDDLPPTYAPDPRPAQIELGSPRKQITLSLPGSVNTRRSGVAFVAEYTMMLFMLGVVILNATWLVYLFFELVVASLNKGAAGALLPAPLAVLWIAATSLVAFPLLAVLWRRTQGEMAENNKEYSQGVPKGWARAFRTFWLVLVGLSTFMLLATGIFAPLATMQDKTPFGDALLGTTIPAIIGTAILGSGMYIATRKALDRKLARLLLLIMAAGSALLIVVNYLWSTNMPAPNKKDPATPRDASPRSAPPSMFDDYSPTSPYDAY